MSTLPFPPDGLRVDELHIRPPTIDDISKIAHAFLDPAVGGEAGMPQLTEPELRSFAEEQLPQLRESGFLQPFLITDGDEILGGVTLQRFDQPRSRVEVGYWLLLEARGRGVARRAVRALADHAFAHGIARIEAVVRPENPPSIRVLEGVGFVREGRLRSLLPHGDGRSDAFIYSLLPGE